MKNEKYFVGLDIGTDSVGYAVTGEDYSLCKFKGEPMWGVTLFDEAQLAVERRGFRAARRRLDRRQHRVYLIQELFAKEIAKVDEGFYKRIKESYLYPREEGQKVRLFGSWEAQKSYMQKYPTVHHLIKELMESNEEHDVRLVYIACAWLVAHRGHFLSEVDKQSVDKVTDFCSVYQKMADIIKHDEYALPWKKDLDLAAVEKALKARLGINKKSKLLAEALFGGKAPKQISETCEYNYELVVKLLCGGRCALKDVFGKEEYAELEEKSVALNMDDEQLAAIMQSVDESDAELIAVLKSVYDWSVLVDILKGRQSISEAKVVAYEQHAKDLKQLKRFVEKYIPQKYSELFRSESNSKNYVSYIGKNITANSKTSVKKAASREELCKYILALFKSVTPDSGDANSFAEMMARLEVNDFLPKQVDGDNRVIPYQLYWYELNRILENAKAYLPFLGEEDEEKITVADKILSVFEFRVPYYVGPLKENPERDRRRNCWMVRKAEGRIYPWNFDATVDLDRSENEFIARMTNSCSYLPGEDVLPKNSLIYSAFEVLNEINNIKINGNDLPVGVKQSIYNNVFMLRARVTPKHIKDYLISNNYIGNDAVISGIDVTVKSSLKPFIQFKNLVSKGLLTYSEVEEIIKRATYSEDRARFTGWLRNNYKELPESEIRYISGLSFKGFGRLSRKLLCGIEGAVDTQTGELMTVIRTMWETNKNLMQIIHSDQFDFKRQIEESVKEYYGANSKSLTDRLDEMYVSNAVKRPIIRTLDILKDVVKVQGCAPQRIFVEMARGTTEDLKGRRSSSRLQQIQELYKNVRDDEVRMLSKQLEDLGDSAHNKLQSDKLFLYFLQLGKCLYTGRSMDISSVMSGDGTYNIEHIYPRSLVKDDSVINNKILVDSKANGEKSDSYPINSDVQNKMRNTWKYLNEKKLISDEKYERLIRTTHFTEEEKYEFINRQLVETRQSTKVVATLLGELYPNTEIVYVKAGLVSDFRHEFDIPKSRAVNDLHHAKDAYLNIVVGNVWHSRFSRQFWRADKEYSIKTEIVFTRPVICNGKTVWRGAEDKVRVVNTVRKNTAHVTKYAFCREGGFFDQMPVRAASNLVPIKKDRPTEIYGGYNKSTAKFFVLVKYRVAKKQDIMVMPVELLYADRVLSDELFANEYAMRTVSEIVNKPVESVEFLLNKRIIKVNTVLSLDGFRVCITGKSGGGRQIGVLNINSFKTAPDTEKYIKRLESFAQKRKQNANVVYSEKFDVISKAENLKLYDYYIQKWIASLYKYRPANPVDTLVNGRDKFINLPIDSQVTVLLSIQGLFGRCIKADLSYIGGASSAGVASLSSSLSNWKKNYTDVRIVDQSASGFFEKVSDNLLDLL